MIIELEDKLLSLDLFQEKFICDLNACKGACCVKGDAGAPLNTAEINLLEALQDDIEPYMTAEGKAAVAKSGVFYMDVDNEPVTTLMVGGACAFTSFDEDGTAKCGIEQSYNYGKINFKKPISCELFPVRVKEYDSFTALNYEQIDICKPTCECGAKLNVSVYQFLKEPLTRAFGADFYESLKEVDKEVKKMNTTND